MSTLISKHLRAVALLLSVVAGNFSSTTVFAYESIAGRVSAFADGDTLRVIPDNTELYTKELKVRMVGIDTPELHLNAGGVNHSQGPCAQEAADYLRALIPVGTRVTVRSFGTDVYGRTLGRIYKAKTDINLEMVKSGWAFPYIYCQGTNCDSNFLTNQNVNGYLAACKTARALKAGNFNKSMAPAEYPFEFRLRIQGRKADKYVGNNADKSLYVPSEYSKVDVCDMVFFATKKDANMLGFN